jgi:hypothetical protein
VRLLNAATGETVHGLVGHTDTVNSMAFAHDGRRMKSGTIELSEPIAHVQDQLPKVAGTLNDVGPAAIAVRGSTEGSQSARFGSKGEDFVLCSECRSA